MANEKDEFRYNNYEIKPITDISGVKLQERVCACGSKFKVTKSSKNKSCSRICAQIPVAAGRLNRAQRQKVADHFDMDEMELFT